MNTFLGIICITALLTIIYSEVSAKSFQYAPKPHVGIVNGTDAEEGEFPYLVQVRDNVGYYVCGGAIIGKKWILTAGHCVHDGRIGSIVYGTNILYNDEDIDSVINVKHIYEHPKFYYNMTKGGVAIPLYDVGILELEENITYSNKAQPVRLVDSDDIPIHVNGALAGWGINATGEYDFQYYLQKINLPLLSTSECTRKIFDFAGEDIFNGTHNLCSDDILIGQCSGDSGSPFVINGTQYGIVSWSLKPCGSNPGTYTRITSPEYREFIKNVTGI